MNSADIARTIQKQLGGRQFSAMVGAKNWLHGTNKAGNTYIQFRVGGGAKCQGKAVNLCTITYVPGRDTYDMEFGYVRGCKVTTRANESDVYADQLCALFTKNTGFYTSL